MNFNKRQSFNEILKYSFIAIIAVVPNLLFAQTDFYTPKALIIPLHDQPKQLFMSVGWGGGLDLNLSYAFTNKLAVFGSSTVNIGTRPGVTILGSSYTTEKDDYVLKGGLGYFSKIDNTLFEVFEASFGAAVTKISNSWYFNGHPEGIEFTDAKYNSVFAQINVGKKNPKTEYAVGIRFNYSKYSEFTFFEPRESSAFSQYQNVQGLSVDPVISFGYNLGSRVMLYAQVGSAIPIGTSPINKIDTYPSYDQQTPITEIASKERVYLGGILGRLSVQYRLSLDRRK